MNEMSLLNDKYSMFIQSLLKLHKGHLDRKYTHFMFFSLDNRNTKQLKTKMPSFYKQQTHFSQIVSKTAKITILSFMKNSKHNNIISVIGI